MPSLYFTMCVQIKVAPSSPAHHCRAVIETLEDRRLMSASTVQTLPFDLDFTSDRGELLDKDGEGTGFTRVQANKLGNEYQPAPDRSRHRRGRAEAHHHRHLHRRRQLPTATTRSSTRWRRSSTRPPAASRSPPASRARSATSTRPSEQAGIMFGPDQDNYVKLVAIAPADAGSSSSSSTSRRPTARRSRTQVSLNARHRQLREHQHARPAARRRRRHRHGQRVLRDQRRRAS